MKKIYDKLSKNTIFIALVAVIVLGGILGFMQYRQHVIDSEWYPTEAKTKKKVIKKTTKKNVKVPVKKTKKHIENAKTIEFDISGDYECGKDFNPGTYYVVLTKLDFGGKDTKKEGYVNISNSGEDSIYDMWSEVGSKKRVRFDEGDELRLSDNYSPTWNVKLYSEKDYKKDSSKITTAS